MHSNLFHQNIAALKQLFAFCFTPEDRYKKIIELGARLPPMNPEDKNKDTLVTGCQSQLYLKASLQDDIFLFTAHSDALISKGLAAVLYIAYNKLPPAEILKNPPTFLQELSISTSLSPSRSHGLMNIYLNIQHNAAALLAQSV